MKWTGHIILGTIIWTEAVCGIWERDSRKKMEKKEQDHKGGEGGIVGPVTRRKSWDETRSRRQVTRRDATETVLRRDLETKLETRPKFHFKKSKN